MSCKPDIYHIYFKLVYLKKETQMNDFVFVWERDKYSLNHRNKFRVSWESGNKRSL